MKLKKIELSTFRNYDKLELEFSKNIVCFTGLNGQGKTNVVEAIAVLGLLNSFRTNNYSDMIKFDSKGFYLRAEFVNKSGRELEVKISYDGEVKKIFFQNKRIIRFSELWGKIPVVYLIPEESLVTSGPPASRRDFIDKLISMIDGEYFSALNDYNKIIKQKNKILSAMKTGESSSYDMLKIYNSKIAELGSLIYKKRKSFLEDFLVLFKNILLNISDGLYEGDIRYETQSDEKEYFKSLSENLSKYLNTEIRRGTTAVGSHKDDLIFLINGRQLRNYGSKGQHKLFLVALKLSGIEYIKSVTDEYPVFIMDDLYSEIDDKKSMKVAKILDNDIQTFITTSSGRIIDQLDPKISQLYKIENGECIAV
ncbi:MAG TPA: DNA replication and repair protein RecF [Clostridiales bacterium]|jgi:DNA replication and repair protein RecF|nr:DNA replication and repair protein RecF [Clostridiales bacterium]HQP70824.1 DNA replication and repair protein RecF [Clostridiales bacterium]